MAYVQITRPYGDLNHQPAVPFNGQLETLQGVIRLIDAQLAELYAAAFTGVIGGTLVASTPGAGSVTGYSPGITIYVDRLDVAADDTNTTINDLTAGFDGQRLRIRNTGAVGTLTLTNANAGSTAATRFSGVGDIALLPGDSMEIRYYAGSVNRWVM